VHMSDMKSALERALERAERLGEASDNDRKRWKYVPEGEKLAARHLKNEGDLLAELDRYDQSVRPFVVEGAQGILVNNIDLPRNEHLKKVNKRAMEALKELKHDKVSLENVYTKLRRVFSHYEQEGEQQRRQAYDQVKKDVEMRLRQAMQQQLGAAAPARINVEAQPQFQQEWRRTLVQLESQYLTLLEEFKQEMLRVP
jgi:hypothetical protein